MKHVFQIAPRREQSKSARTDAQREEHSRRMRLVFASATPDAREWERRHKQRLDDAIRVAKAQGTMR